MVILSRKHKQIVNFKCLKYLSELFFVVEKWLVTSRPASLSLAHGHVPLPNGVDITGVLGVLALTNNLVHQLLLLVVSLSCLVVAAVIFLASRKQIT